VEPGRKWLAALAVLVAVNLALVGALHLRFSAREPDPMATRQGFTAGMLQPPLFPPDDPNLWDPLPENASRFPPGYSMQAAWTASRAYAGWGGELRTWLKNTGQNELYVYGISVEGGWGPAVCATVGVLVPPGQERYLGIIHFPGPGSPGTYDYSFRTGIKAESREGIIPKTGWWDYGYISTSLKPMEFRPAAEPVKYKERSNPAHYFDKANRLMDSKDPAVLRKAAEIAARFPGGFSIFQAAAAFDFVHNNVTYLAEPAGEDRWQSPAETLRLLTGDCEDYTLLLSALLTAMGGQTRFHVETDHAFLSVFIGGDPQPATDSLSRYYNTDLRTVSFGDRFGQWLCADATDSAFLGALPLGGEPLTTGGWGLTNTTVHYPVDIIPD